MSPDLAKTLVQARAAAGAAGLEACCQEFLRQRRGLDAPGAAQVAARDLAGLVARALGPGGVLEPLLQGLEDLAGRQACLGCATCCRLSSPTLYAPDLELIARGGLPRRALYTLRTGERVSSARLSQGLYLESELIKLDERPGQGCLFLEGCACGLYQHRPLQCRHLECWSGRHAGQLETTPRLSRQELYAHDPQALALLAEYEERLPGGCLARALERAAQGGDQREALDCLELDHRLRLGIAARYGYGPEEQPLLLGRPARVVALAHGLALTLDRRGKPVLKPLAGQV